ncbi:MAG: carbamoyl-phosphate synthase large subunit [Flavobacteriales bacterium]|nr:carbamoyl-phosphate synthase large subunit [Flavobacteriales bacterium]
MPKDTSIRSVLLIGSGPIIIGQACEFDYSGSQASRSLRGEGIEVTLINSNPATIMTDPVTADNVYLLPLTTESIETILKKHKIDAVLPTMGGQTALNLAIECEKLGLWKQYGVRMIGVDTAAIDITENRERFRKLMESIGIPSAPSKTVTSFLEGKKVAQEFGFPLVIRASYTLGGTGAAFVHRPEDFDKLLKHGLQVSPIHEVLIDKALLGWKEYELELLRDKDDNVAIICSIENFDPMGIHTGDSITVAPAMTLSDRTYQKMRTLAIKMMRSIGDFAGGCNVQFAVSPDEHEHIYAIEINPRVSRSSALASKATGYPIAKIASKLAIGYRLDELENPITGTSACFEPTLDYVIVKIPRWNFEKFEGSDRRLGVQMKSVGEVMGIGRSFQEALQKACQSLEIKRNGLGADGRELTDANAILESLANPSWHRLFHVYDAIKLGIPFKKIHDLTRIDIWFLKQIEDMILTEKEVEKYTLDTIPDALLFEAKQKGYADRQVAHLLDCLESEVYKKRNDLGIKRVYKLVDTCAGEFTAKTPYYYSTFEEENESIRSDRPKIVVLGSGPNRIGQGIEFDYSCVHGVLAAKECGYETIMINCNPETVSTDFDTADKLYFEPVFWEHIYDIIQHEQPEGVIVQLGGQTALKLAEKMQRYGIKIMGTQYEALDMAEDRERFSSLLRDLKIPYPKFAGVNTAEEAILTSRELGFPLLVRPSYVLGGQKMKIVINEDELEAQVLDILHNMPDNRILIDHFLDGAIEAESDSICDGEEVRIIGIMEHIEPAGIHSGDSNAVLPPFDLSPHVMEQIENHTKKIALALKTKGLVNIQFAIKDEVVYVIEANPRASRTVPFIAKAYGEPYVNWATKVMLGKAKVKDFPFKPKLEGYAIKVPVFSFDKFPDVDKSLGPEMKSTGEAIHFIKDLKDPFFREVYGERSMYLSR